MRHYIEEFGSLEAVKFSISFGGIEQNGQAGSIKLIKELSPVRDRRLRSLDEKIGRPSNKLQLEPVHIKFFVIKDWFHANMIT
jgi:hypothetical protein